MKLEEMMPKLREGRRMRSGHWPEQMYIVLMPGYPEGIPVNQATAKAHGIEQGTVVKFRPYIQLVTVDGSMVPFVATQSDLLTEAWEEYHG
ncbi:Thoeris anti-defense Tad2 family protein [Streptomyces sp. NPDC002248]